ncbi:4-hydroxy-3-methylbut-2-enyl diphosphate reductase [Thermomicrobiaceae bacterium CFH 74404]|uniref:4-hydroxy-3-methylbut-2-enyl diphosphate reductase n=1 Tax=Thermalbibacter longus TaxID=2951981 RepID=A0AA41WC64_9BACT|nr:4-hydroxy-3-methylbut-2-enyl diphosphate reductase [Thermalbibacter longus]MCM8747744.1 4-hydroxy-3-methylbut-2-enyl diphosphate reductase [Thermalbibacter longus]
MTVTTKERRIVLAEVMGYCWGVRRALEIIQQAAQEGGPVATVGDVIHNPQVVQRLRGQGIEPLPSVPEAKARGFQRVAITAHGAGPDRAQEAQSHGLTLIDTTCPLVTKVQRLAEKLVRQGYFLVVYGDAHHPEVRGVLGWAGTSRAVAAKHLSDLPWTGPRGVPGVVAPPRKVALVSQTTKQTDEFLAFAVELTSWVARHGGEVRIINTICQPTWERQEALKALAQEVDVILAIGGKKSSNTARLAEVGRACGVPSYHIEGPSELDPGWFQDAQVVGLTAGASTPDEVVWEVIEALVGMGYRRPEKLWRYEAPDLDDFAE